MTPTAIWKAVDRLIDTAPSPRDLGAHGLHLLAVRRWRAEGRPIPTQLIAAERVGSFVALAAPAVLAEARAAYDGPIVVFKGPELAARYPDPGLRSYGDLDLLVPDPKAAYVALVAAGFIPVGPPPADDFHHVQPLHSPRFPLRVELHARPSWVAGAKPPPLDELLQCVQPAAVGAPDVLAPSPAHHVMLLAAHAWTHEPLGRISHLLDIALVTAECDRADLEDLAARWEATRLWATTVAMTDFLFFRRDRLRRPFGCRLASSHAWRNGPCSSPMPTVRWRRFGSCRHGTLYKLLRRHWPARCVPDRARRGRTRLAGRWLPSAICSCGVPNTSARSAIARSSLPTGTAARRLPRNELAQFAPVCRHERLCPRDDSLQAKPAHEEPHGPESVDEVEEHHRTFCGMDICPIGENEVPRLVALVQRKWRKERFRFRLQHRQEREPLSSVQLRDDTRRPRAEPSGMRVER